METVKCPECPNTATGLDCPHLGPLVRMTVLRLQHGHWRGPEPQQPLSSPPRGLMHENHSPAIAAELSVPERILLFCVASAPNGPKPASPARQRPRW
jgi:hypothetical protein